MKMITSLTRKLMAREGGQSPNIKFMKITRTNNFTLVGNEFNYHPPFEERFYVQMPQRFVYTKEGPKNE